MAKFHYSWFEVYPEFVRIKFVDNIKPSELTNEKFQVWTSEATPQEVLNPFNVIDTAKDYDSISRILTLWWLNSPPETGTYIFQVFPMTTFLNELLDGYSIEFDWSVEQATPPADPTTQPSREPVDVEDYSIKIPGWSIIESGESATPTSGLSVLDIIPGVETHHSLEEDENDGRIDILFSQPINSNYLSPYYFTLTRKEVKRGFSKWEEVDTIVVAGQDSQSVSIYLAQVDSEAATPVYSYLNVLESPEFFSPQYEYRLIISGAIGAAPE